MTAPPVVQRDISLNALWRADWLCLVEQALRRLHIDLHDVVLDNIVIQRRQDFVTVAGGRHRRHLGSHIPACLRH